MSDNTVVNIRGNEYKKFSARLRPFFEKFPIEEGWQIKTKVTSLFDEKGQLKKIIKTILKSGKDPAEFGIDLSILKKNAFKFKATLISPEGKKMLSASAVKTVDINKQWEVGESSAMQRLIAMAGFHGSIIDGDEVADMVEQGLIDQKHKVAVKESKPTIVKTQQVKEQKAVKKGTVEIPTSLIRMIEKKCKQLNIAIPTYNSFEEAQKVFNDLQATKKS